MNDQLARKILEVSPYATPEEIKKQYRAKMRTAHPDNDAFTTDASIYDAAKLNEAYAYLTDHYAPPKIIGKAPARKTASSNGPRKYHSSTRKKATDQTNATKKASTATGSNATANGQEKMDHDATASGKPNHEYNQKRAHQKSVALWNAKINPRAYCDRDIFQHAEDMEGNIIGNYYVCSGKYYWTKDEDFMLFLQSMLQCSKRLLDEIDEELDREPNMAAYALVQANLSYLLAQQFIDTQETLKELALQKGQDKDSHRYKIHAMLEYTSYARANAFTHFMPAYIKQHKLYIKNEEETILGYISFPDDRLYYVLIPLFEQKTVQVKFSLGTAKKPHSTRYEDLDMWIKIPKVVSNSLPESIQLQIQELLDAYRN